jgi:hypothetical protein
LNNQKCVFLPSQIRQCASLAAAILNNEMIQITQADSVEELEQILSLQQANHVAGLSAEQKKLNGYITATHTLELLIQMNAVAPQIIAKDKDKVVAYALVMPVEFKDTIPMLIPMFEMFNSLWFKGKKLSDYSFYVMGQICIAEPYRGLGIFEQLYLKHKAVYSGKFDICLTEVSVNNHRSMRAHQNIGLQTIHTYRDATDEWNIMLWDWEKNKNQ